MGRLKNRNWVEINIWPNIVFKGCKLAMSAPDLTILYSHDAEEWNQYLSDCFQQDSEPLTLDLHHEKLEDLPFPLSCTRSQSFSSSKAVLVILSPDFLDFIDSHPEEVFELGKLLKQNRTVAMLCGVQDSDISTFHKASLVSYDSWPRLVARDQDKEFVVSVIHTTQEIIERASSVQKAQFKLSPRKVKEGNGKVFAILNKPINEKQKIQVFLDGDGIREMVIKFRNPYTIQFVVPDSFMQGSKMMNVLIRCDDYLLGVRQLKCESKMSELYSLLSVVNSPYELLCRTLGVESLHEIDAQLVKSFRKNIPSCGFNLLESNQELEKKKSEEEIPTLLHFSARYGLRELTSQLLQCPGAAQACCLRNARGLIPCQLANHAGYVEIAELLEDFKKMVESEKSSSTREPVKTQLSTVYEQMQDYPCSLYDVPFPVPIPAVPILPKPCCSPEENDYLGMFGFQPKDIDSLEPHKKLVFGFDQCREMLVDLSSDSSPTEQITENKHSDEVENSKKLPLLSESQQELIQIMEAYKHGASFNEVSNLYTCWQKKHQNSIEGGMETIDNLRKLYKESQKSKQNKKIRGFSELRQMISNALGRKETKAKINLKSYERQDRSPEKSLGEDSFLRPVSTLSTASSLSTTSSSSSDRFSTVSIGSTYDSGNHSDSCDEVGRLKDSSMGNDSQSNSSNQSLPLSERPPAPPPRPAAPPPTTRKKPNLKHAYYMFPSIPMNDSPKVTSPDYVQPDSDYLLSSKVDAALNKATDRSSAVKVSSPLKKPLKPSFSSSQEQTKTPLERNKFLNRTRRSSCTPSPTQTSKYLSQDECIYYDIPAPPVPVGIPKSSSENSLPTVGNSTYDIPKSLANTRCRRPNCKPREPTYIEVYVNKDDQDINNENLDYDIPKPLLHTRHNSLPRETTTYTGLIKPPQKENSGSSANYYNVIASSHDDVLDSIPDETPPPPPTDEDPYKVMISPKGRTTPPLPPRLKNCS